MATKVIAGSRITLQIATQDPDTLVPIPGLPVFLDRLDQPSGAPVQVAGATTDGQGRATVIADVPAVEGSYIFRARFPGVADKFRADTSPNLTITAVMPTA